ncbi:shikimate kinase [Ostreibacterium oceani]|uniref:Shikimate kinase n=1 Tax=Ostreibacterium oceani TaxID=2654998 RepID=A0A6N7EVL5_9GAMM|nr:shikimate kinase [Ostreibacterium oceani]MPV86804.1 AAA family ATPase [Ostreibacterium oceani]
MIELTGNIVLVGPMGAGKTTLGKKIAQHFHVPFIDVDDTIEQHLGVDIQTIFDTEGESGFRSREAAVLDKIFETNHCAVIATGGGCVLTEACRQMIMRQRLVVHTDVGLNQQYIRLRHDKKRPILQQGNLKNTLKRLRAERHELYCGVADLYLLTDGRSFRSMIQCVESALTDQV